MRLLAVRSFPAALNLPAVSGSSLVGAFEYGALRRRPTCIATCDSQTQATIVSNARKAGCGKYEKNVVVTKLKLGARGCRLCLLA
jgi:hypothetical protein